MLLCAHNLSHTCCKILYTIEVKKSKWKEGITCLFTTRARIELMQTKENFLSAHCFLFFCFFVYVQ